MKSEIHPQYNEKSSINCACGNKWTTGSILSKIDIEICDKCHPFFSGKDKKVDRRGRLDRFQKRAQQAETKSKVSSTKTRKKVARAAKKSNLEKTVKTKAKTK